MTAVFLKLLNMSIAASWLVLAVILLRFLLRTAPKWISCLLWGFVALRLVIPFALESPLSLIPSPEVIPADVAVSQTPAIYSGIPTVNSAVNPLITTHFAAEGNSLEQLISVAAWVWLAGFGLMLLYSTVTYIKLRRQVRVSLRQGDNVYICDSVDSPFLLGIFRPRIYIPSGMEPEQLQYVLAHEKVHMKRRDHWWKPLGFGLLCLHWFNPLIWAAYILLCRDVERACDEKVIVGMGPADRIGYSQALAACSVHRRLVMACPVAFGEEGVKSRIKGVLHYKKPAFWIILASVAVCGVTAVCFLTNPKPCNHSYQAQVTTVPTCTEKGIQTCTCDRCRHSYTVAVDRIAHTYDIGVVTQQPDCTHPGSMLLECIHCGNQKTQTVEMTGHIVGGPMYITAPDCTHTGTRTATCTHCHSDFVAEIYPTNNDHDLKETVLKEATCTAPGEGEWTCSRCGYSEKCSYAQLEHQYTKSTVQAATCLKEGVDRYTCSACGSFYQVETPFGEHSFTITIDEEATYSMRGIKRYVCSVCAYFYEIITPPKGHNWYELNSRHPECSACDWHGESSVLWFGVDKNDLLSGIGIWS